MSIDWQTILNAFGAILGAASISGLLVALLMVGFVRRTY